MMTPWLRRAGLVAAGALATTAPVILADQAGDEAATDANALAAAAAWRDVLDGYRGPQLPPPSDAESAIVVLEGDAVAMRPAAERAAAAGQIALQQASVEPSLVGLGATINFRYRALVNGFGIRVPAGRLPLVAELPGVKAVYPVTYLTPAASDTDDPEAQPLPGSATAPAAAPPAAPPAAMPATIALIDAGVHSAHPWLGGGIGPDRLIIGGADLVGGRPTPEAPAETRVVEAHGTELAGLVLNAPALQGLPVDRVPRMLAYRVMAREFVDGRVRLLARSDRVLAALERAVDPNQDANLDDHVGVILVGVSRGFGAGGADPLAQAAIAADRAGALVVAPAGNDGPSTDPGLGSIAGPAAGDAVLTVGGLAGAAAPRTAHLDLVVGPATASLTKLPIMGPPSSGQMPIVVLASADGLVTGDDPRDYADARGRSRVQGALAVVGRGGGTIPGKARAAAAAGAAAIAVWDQDGAGRFPGIRGDGEIPIPVVGLGSRQGAVLVEHADLRGTIVEDPGSASVPMVASFSSRGPAADGTLEPDLIAPAVDVETAYPGEGAEQLVARVSGTSAAAAQVAAMALRARIDRPTLDPADIRSLLVQAATPVAGASARDQGAGVAQMPAAASIAIRPAIVSGRRTATAPVRLSVTLHELAGRAGMVSLAVTDVSGLLVPPTAPVALPAGGVIEAAVTLPPGDGELSATLNVIDENRVVLAATPIVVGPPPRRAAVLGLPVVRIAGDVAEARVTIGGGTRTAATTSPVHDLGIWLVPSGGGEAIRMAGAKAGGDWPVGTYRFMLTRRRVDGAELSPGRYRVRVTATGPGGAKLSRESAVFRLP